MSCYGKQIYDCEPNVGEIWLHKSYENEFTVIDGREYSEGIEILFVWGGCTGPTTVFYHDNWTGFNGSMDYQHFADNYRFARKSR